MSSPEETSENVAVSDTKFTSYVIAIVVGGLVAAAYYYFIVLKKKDDVKKNVKEVDIDNDLTSNSVDLKDITYIASKLKPDSTHLDVLFAVASAPESIAWGTKAHLRRERTLRERQEKDKKDHLEKRKETSKKSSSNDSKMFDLDDDGWADEDDDDMDDEAKEKAKRAKQAEEEKKKARDQLKAVSEKNIVILEGLDEGVIGQKWVESTLSKVGAWPPQDMRFLDGMTFEYNGKEVSALDHPGLRRNLCHVCGRINSIALNSHSDLLEAVSKQKIDQTYFKASAEFRQRCAMLLEAALRTAIGFRNFPLASTIVETVGMFRIGCKSPDEVEWFDGVMKKTYNGALPRIEFANVTIENPKDPEMATGDILLISLELTRLHAEAFTRQKVAALQKQGIPPQVALQTYREGWWYFLRGDRLDGEVAASTLEIKTDGILSQVEDSDVERFNKSTFQERLLTAWPMIVQNVAQKSGKVKIQFKAPSVPGKYKFTVTVKSQDFLGADQEFSIEADIVDVNTVDRKPKEEVETKTDNPVELGAILEGAPSGGETLQPVVPSG